MGYDEINLNVGCPSPRVQSGSFGACLMKEPGLVARCMTEMQKVVNIPCTVKCRLGIDDYEEYDFTKQFIEEVSKNSKVTHFIIHARNAILSGLSPAENRVIPPLKY
jgi:tRNA-dihydrouridine synthase A